MNDINQHCLALRKMYRSEVKSLAGAANVWIYDDDRSYGNRLKFWTPALRWHGHDPVEFRKKMQTKFLNYINENDLDQLMSLETGFGSELCVHVWNQRRALRFRAYRDKQNKLANNA